MYEEFLRGKSDVKTVVIWAQRSRNQKADGLCICFLVSKEDAHLPLNGGRTDVVSLLFEIVSDKTVYIDPLLTTKYVLYFLGMFFTS